MTTQRGAHVAMGLVLVLTTVLHLSAAQNTGTSNAEANCKRPCVPIRQCPSLIQLLQDPTIENINRLRAATCRVTNRLPKVCCPSSLIPRTCGRSFIPNRIFGGTEAGIGSFPWMAALGYTEPGVPRVKYLCGGSVINERYILTAAHCLNPVQLGDKSLHVVTLGDFDLSTPIDCDMILPNVTECAPPARNYSVESVTLHPAYNTRTTYSDDIALIRLTEAVDLTGETEWVHPVCLPPASLDVAAISGTREPVVTGWGFTENGTFSDRMLKVAIPFFNKQQCNATYKGRLVDEQLCLGGREGQDSCSGDSGGPLVVIGPRGPPYLQIGLVSYGPSQCGQSNYPAVYTAISPYRNWIELNIRP